MASDLEIDGIDVRTYLFLCSRLNFDTFTQIRQMEIWLELRRQQTHISRSIRKLTAKGFLIAGEKGTRGAEWKLNANYAKENHGGG
jgi:hypothetical protein